MFIHPTLGELAIDESMIQNLLLLYCDHSENKPGAKRFDGPPLRERLYSIDAVYQSAMQAATEGFVLSTLAAVARNDADYQAALDAMQRLDDPEMRDVRAHVFRSGTRAAAESMGVTLAKSVGLGERIERFGAASAQA